MIELISMVVFKASEKAVTSQIVKNTWKSVNGMLFLYKVE